MVDVSNTHNLLVEGPRAVELLTLPSQMHNHDHHYSQIVIGLKGQTEFEISGIGSRIGPGKGCLVTSGNIHAFGGLKDPSDILVLNLLLKPDTDATVLERIANMASKECYFQLDTQIQRLITLLAGEIRTYPNDAVLTNACGDTIVALLQKHISAMPRDFRDHRFDLSVIDKYIERNIQAKITVAQLAGSVYLGESQFHQLFKELVGVTPHQYVLQRRIEIAQKLIDQGQYSLGQVADLTGFSNQSTFNHSFSRLLGMSPSRYKQRQS